MIVSWNWLREYVQPAESADGIVGRLTMSGLNHEHSGPVGDDVAIDLEVTSNRPDCLGHIGIAREIAALCKLPLTLPDPNLPSPAEADSVPVRIDSPAHCSLYTGRVIRGVKVGPSPDWLVQRLATIGVASVNNVVDCTNYVMFECGQPLHAFDLKKLSGPQITVREAAAGESIDAINHQQYPLEPGMCVIADAARPVAIAGVMGGAGSEVTTATTDLLIEAAVFAPASVRSAARRLNLHSPSSYRFERGVDPAGVDWASRRCCELILRVAGGKLAGGPALAGQAPASRLPIVFRPESILRILGIEIPPERMGAILRALGCLVSQADPRRWEVTPPTWRADLTREIDLVEEIGRIHGYGHVPDQVDVPMVASSRSLRQRSLSATRSVLLGTGFDEAMTPTLVPRAWSDCCSPWTDSPPLQTGQPMLGVLERASQTAGAVDCVRRSLIPSLLEARRINEHRGLHDAELFETAAVYLPGVAGLPDEPLMLGLVSSRGFSFVRGVVDLLVRTLNPDLSLSAVECDAAWLDPTVASRLVLDGSVVGWLGMTSVLCTRQFSLRAPVAVAELNLDALFRSAVPVRKQVPVSPFPAVSRDFNFVVDETVRWEGLERAVRAGGGSLLESVTYRETFRDPARDGAGRKRILLTVVLRSLERTLSAAELESTSSSIVGACQKMAGARLLS